MTNANNDSAPCLQGQNHPDINPAYQGTPPPPVLVEALQTLLKAERAGVRVATESLASAELSPVDRQTLEKVHADEAQSCRLLRQLMLDLGIEPTEEVGDFYAKAMAIADVDTRLKLVDRGRLWVFNNLTSLLGENDQAYIANILQQVKDLHAAPVPYSGNRG